MRLPKLHLLVAAVGIAAAAGVAWWWQHERAAGAAPVSSAASAPGLPGNGGAAPRGPSAAGGPVVVEVARAATLALADEATAVGSLRARQGIVVRPEVSGRIVELGFRDGQRVRRGQLLVQLDDTLQRAQLQQARAQASIARTTLQRNRELVAQNFVSRSAVDQSAAALEVAESQVALADAQLKRMRVLAPFDGVTGIRDVDVGDYVRDGADIVRLEDTAAMLVDFRLPERVSPRVRRDQSVEVQLDGLAGRAFVGRIEAIDSQVDADGRSLLVRARLDNPDDVLRPGMFARSRIVFEVRRDAVVVPEEALVPSGGRQYLVRVVDDGRGPVSRKLEARIGLRVPGRVEILEGVAAGDIVVTAGQAPLLAADGRALKIVDVDAPGSRAAPAATAPAAAADGASAPAPRPGTAGA